MKNIPRETYENIHIGSDNRDCPEAIIAFSSVSGRRPYNEDYVGLMLGSREQQLTRGSTLVVTDGMSGGQGGRVAAELAARSFIESYYGVADTLSPELAAGKALESINRWLYILGRNDPYLKNMAASFAALILRGREAYLVSAGDVRLYLWRAGRLVQVSEDHVFNVGFGELIARAPGLDENLLADFRPIDINDGDRLLLCSDGLYRFLPKARLQELMETKGDASTTARALIEEGLKFGSQDNITAAVVDIVRLPALDIMYLERIIGELPILNLPKIGSIVDGYIIKSVIYDGYYSRLFLAEDGTSSGRRLLMKFPKPRVVRDENIRRAFVREGWISSRIKSPWIVEAIHVARERQSQVYMVMPFYEGETLEKRIKRKPIYLAEGLEIASNLAKAIYSLNRNKIYHRDIKPENVLLLNDGGLKLLDLGFAYIPGVLDPAPPFTPGTPSYMAPELVRGETGDERSEVFAYGITIFQLFSGGEMPYGLRKRKLLKQYRSDLPDWLDPIIGKALDEDPKNRYQDILEIAYDLDHSEKIFAISSLSRKPYFEISQLFLWRSISVILLVALLLYMAKY